MQMPDLAKAYQTKTDEELLQLASDSERLTPEAHAILRSELAVRRIDVPKHLTAQEESDQGRSEQPRTRGTPFIRDSHAVREFVAEVVHVYHGQFWLFIKLIAPAVVVSYIAVVMARNEVREIERHLPRGVEVLKHETEILEIGLLNLAGYLVSWIGFCFSFGAICSAVQRIEAGAVPAVSDCFSAVRERMGSFLRLCLFLFGLLLLAEAAAVLLSQGVFWVLHYRQLHLSLFTIEVVSYGSIGLALLMLSRFGLAIPALVVDNYRVGQAMFRSDELTEGKWLTLAVLLSKSLIGGYVAGMLPFWLASWIQTSIVSPAWFRWVLTAASIAGVTVVEPTMFIGFVLLYLRMSPLPSTSSGALARQLA